MSPWALIVGASNGIGAAFAEELADRGTNLVLVARTQAALDELASRLPGNTRTVAVDASTSDGIAIIKETPEDIGLLVCNAALGPIGPFLDLSPGQLDAMLDLNCRAAAQLSHAFAARMVERGGGGIVLLSSMAGNQGSAEVAHYAATKAYLRVLAEGLWAELRPFKVDVVASCPGLVDTPTFARTRPRGSGRLVPGPMGAREVVSQTLDALGRQPVVIPGRRNRLLAGVAARLLTRRQQVVAASRRTRAMYPRGSRREAQPGGSGE